MPKEEKYKFSNLPKKYTLADYRTAIGYIVKKYSNTNGLLSIYNWGNPSAPGISDIDIVFVFDKYASKHLPFSKRSFYLLDSDTRYLVRHPFVFIDEESFADLKYIYPDGNLELLHGKNIKIKNISHEEEYYANIALLNDIIIRHYPRDFLGQLVCRNINVRDTLLRLNSLKYTIRTLENISKKKNNEYKNIINNAEKLRKNWFRHNDFDRLVLLNKEAVKISMNIIEDFKNIMSKNKIAIVDENNLEYNGIKNKTLFVNGWDKEKSLQKMSAMVKIKNKFYSILPIELSAHLVEYSKASGIISRYIKNNLSKTIDYKLRHKETIKKRIDILNSQAALANALKHSDFLAFFDFGCRSKAGINNWLINLSDKFRF